MDPLSILGAAAIGAAGVCAATDCMEPKQHPPVTVVQRVAAQPPLEPPNCPSLPPPATMVCEPKQVVACAPPDSGKPQRVKAFPRIPLLPPKVDVQISCTDKPCTCPPQKGPIAVMTNVIRQGDEKKNDPRPQDLRISLGIWNHIFGTNPPPECLRDQSGNCHVPMSPGALLTMLMGLALTVNIPLAANITLSRKGAWRWLQNLLPRRRARKGRG